MPPNHISKLKLQKHKISGLSPEHTFSGGHFASAEQANSVTFVPKDIAEKHKIFIQPHYALPLLAFQNPKTTLMSCINWGCKIYTNGQYFLSFFGEVDYLDYADLPKDDKFERIQGQLKTLLERKIDVIKNGNSDKKLSQTEQSEILKVVVKKISTLEPEWKIYYHRDYEVDRAELLSFLSKNSSFHYRKAFSLCSDINADYKITESQIT